MAKSAIHINWRYAGDAVPAFITMALMPFTYSIANGLIGGICTYIVINTLVWILEKLSGGRIVPPNKHEKEPWTWRVSGGLLPRWLTRLFGKKSNRPEENGIEQDDLQKERQWAGDGVGSETSAGSLEKHGSTAKVSLSKKGPHMSEHGAASSH